MSMLRIRVFYRVPTPLPYGERHFDDLRTNDAIPFAVPEIIEGVLILRDEHGGVENVIPMDAIERIQVGEAIA